MRISTQVLTAYFITVYCKQCNTAGCDGQLDFDGYDVGLLNMKTYLVAHEVLRGHMYHFLLGRYYS